MQFPLFLAKHTFWNPKLVWRGPLHLVSYIFRRPVNSLVVLTPKVFKTAARIDAIVIDIVSSSYKIIWIKIFALYTGFRNLFKIKRNIVKLKDRLTSNSYCFFVYLNTTDGNSSLAWLSIVPYVFISFKITDFPRFFGNSGT